MPILTKVSFFVFLGIAIALYVILVMGVFVLIEKLLVNYVFKRNRFIKKPTFLKRLNVSKLINCISDIIELFIIVCGIWYIVIPQFYAIYKG